MLNLLHHCNMCCAQHILSLLCCHVHAAAKQQLYKQLVTCSILLHMRMNGTATSGSSALTNVPSICTAGRLMRTILYSTEHVSANNWETALFILFLMFFAVAASAYVLYHGLQVSFSFCTTHLAFLEGLQL